MRRLPTGTSLLATAMIVFVLSSTIVGLGGLLSFRLRGEKFSAASALDRFDTSHYKEIVESGYQYDAGKRSNVAFFPLYPLSVRLVAAATGWSTSTALLATSNAYTLAALLTLAWYAKARRENAAQGELNDAASDWEGWSFFALALFPTTFFLHVSYSESCFLFFAALTFNAMARRWPLWMIAVIVGLASAARPVGISLLAPLVIHVLANAVPRAAAAWLAILIPLGSWGLLAYMLFQHIEFGDPLAFAKTQEHWRVREPADIGEKALSLAAGEPLWGGYVPWSVYHRLLGDVSILSLTFMNPLYFVGTGVCIGMGVWKSWLTREEAAVSILLLGIPYVTRGFEWGLLSQGRFAAVVFPAYFVMGQLLARLPREAALSLLAVSGFLLGAYAALFAAGESFF